jgi:hypothetical protein
MAYIHFDQLQTVIPNPAAMSAAQAAEFIKWEVDTPFLCHECQGDGGDLWTRGCETCDGEGFLPAKELSNNCFKIVTL